MSAQKTSHVLLGCVADDFTGASDAASFLAGQGIKTLLFNGVPSHLEDLEGCAAIVIATKTRSIPAQEAVQEAENAFRWLEQAGVEQFYYKYCSTFDSTPKGNIGPVTDCGLSLFGCKYTLLCPALPVNGRKVIDGVLYVNGVPLAESPMKNHPLNPMWESRLDLLMKPQAQYDCLILGQKEMALPDEEILALVEEFGKDRQHFYIIPDYKDEADGEKIARLFGDCRFLTGGSGILAHMAARYKAKYDLSGGDNLPTGTPGQAILLAGSCSKATSGQIARYRNLGPSFPVYGPRLVTGQDSAASLWADAICCRDKAPLFYSAGSADSSLRSQESEEEKAAVSAALEKAMAGLAQRAYQEGATRIIVAGGETSGAIAVALGFDSYLIGESVAPGVPVMIPLRNKKVRVVYKSGNFGDEDFFQKALDMTKG